MAKISNIAHGKCPNILAETIVNYSQCRRSNAGDGKRQILAMQNDKYSQCKTSDWGIAERRIFAMQRVECSQCETSYIGNGIIIDGAKYGILEVQNVKYWQCITSNMGNAERYILAVVDMK